MATGLVDEATLAIVEVAAPKLVIPLEPTKPLDSAPADSLELAVGVARSDEETWDPEGVAMPEELAAEMTSSSTLKVTMAPTAFVVVISTKTLPAG